MPHLAHLRTLLALTGLRAVDIGAGDGSFSAGLAAEGAHVTAIEVDAAKVAAARAALPGTVEVRLGGAEALPLADASQDLACMVFSLHHVPRESHDAAFGEIARTVRPGGRLHVVEPFARGTMFEVVRLVDDETEVREAAGARLLALGDDPRFALKDRTEYTLTRAFASAESLVERLVRVDPARRAAFEAAGGRVERRFARLAERRGDAWLLHQPCVACHFVLTGA